MSSARPEEACCDCSDSPAPGSFSHFGGPSSPSYDIAADPDLDSAYDDSEETDSETLRSWILDYRIENNRTYHAYGQHDYWGSNDDAALEHMEIGHALFTRALGNRLFLSPIGDSPHNILDIGTGTGSWAIDVADEYPSARVVGTDLSPTQPTWVPANVDFEIDDCEAEFTWPDNHFDFIHIRGLFGTIRDWPRLYAQCLRVLRPGGYLERTEHSPAFASDDDSIPPNGGIDTWNKVGLECHIKAGTELVVVETMAEKMRDAGFVQVHEHPFKWPIGKWPRDPEMKALGRLAYHFFDTGAENWTMRLLTSVLDWSQEQVFLLCANLRKDLQTPSVHAVNNGRIVYGRKPIV